MLFAALVALSPAFAVVPPSATAQARPICHNPGIVTARAANTTGTIRPLGDEPPAQHILAVVRTDFADGCVKPVVVNAQIGTPKR